jgi:uncharacterized RmlC-like cupin family protein
MTSTAAPSVPSVPSAPNAARIRLVPPAEHTPLTTQTPGMERREVLAHPGVWIGLTRTAPGSTSGWHHHADMETYIYVQSGSARFDFGADGGDTCLAVAGDLLHVPRWAVHREANEGDAESVLLIVRVGEGEPVVNVAGPVGRAAPAG